MDPSPVPEAYRDVIGCPVEDLDTPALLLDLVACEENLRRMAEFFRRRRCRLRPHFKNHKCPALAQRQLLAGSAAGITCAKLGEAEVLADRGFTDLLIANQVVGRRKTARLVEVARKSHVKVAVDDLRQVEAISRAAEAGRVTVGVLLEIDIGMGRCGLPPGRPALDLARKIESLPGIRFDGLQAYEGHAVYVTDFERRAELVRQAMANALETRELLEDNGFQFGVLSGGSSATYQITGQIDGVDEIQAGTYATMDWRYAELSPEFQVAMTVLSRVISKRPGAAVLDVGLKGVGSEFGPPRIKDHPEVEIPSFLSEEHCIVRRAPEWRVGDAVQIIPSHACTTCNLHRQFYVCEDGRVVDVWPIEASGRLA